jgi:hypothetical protein
MYRVITQVNPTACEEGTRLRRLAGGDDQRVPAGHRLAGLREFVPRPVPETDPGPGPAREARRRDGDGEDCPTGEVRLGRVAGAGRHGQEYRDGTSSQSGPPPAGSLPRLVHVLLPLRPHTRPPGHLNSRTYAANNTRVDGNS